MYKILIVDDDIHLAQIMGILFNQRGFKAQAVTTAETAKDALAASVPDLVLTDINPYGAAVLHEVHRLRQSDARYGRLESAVMSGQRANDKDAMDVCALTTSGLFFQKGSMQFDHVVEDIVGYLDKKLRFVG